MEHEAPDFNPGYPSGGERIGPAWVKVWNQLSETRWTQGAPLALALAEETNLNPATIRGLLWQGAKAGLLEKKLTERPGPNGAKRKLALYRKVARNNQEA